MRKLHKEAAADLREECEKNEEMIGDHEAGLHVHEEEFIETARQKTEQFRRLEKAHEDRTGQED